MGRSRIGCDRSEPKNMRSLGLRSIEKIGRDHLRSKAYSSLRIVHNALTTPTVTSTSAHSPSLPQLVLANAPSTRELAHCVNARTSVSGRVGRTCGESVMMSAGDVVRRPFGVCFG
jgi:hypothetical protein